MKNVELLIVAAVLSFASAELAAAVFIGNGTFEGGFAPGVPGPLDLAADQVPNQWSRYETFSGRIAETSAISAFNQNGPSAPGAWSTHFIRSAPENTSGDWTSVFQSLNINASMYSSLTLSMDVMVDWHNLAAGGWVAPAFEWPAVVQIAYTTTGGAFQFWRYGWYVNPPGDGNGSPINDPGYGLIPIFNDQQVPVHAWMANSFDLLKELPQVRTIDQIIVGGSGWQYESYFDNVSLLGRPSGVPESGSIVGLTACSLGLLFLIGQRRRSPDTH